MCTYLQTRGFWKIRTGLNCTSSNKAVYPRACCGKRQCLNQYIYIMKYRYVLSLNSKLNRSVYQLDCCLLYHKRIPRWDTRYNKVFWIILSGVSPFKLFRCSWYKAIIQSRTHSVRVFPVMLIILCENEHSQNMQSLAACIYT